MHVDLGAQKSKMCHTTLDFVYPVENVWAGMLERVCPGYEGGREVTENDTPGLDPAQPGSRAPCCPDRQSPREDPHAHPVGLVSPLTRLKAVLDLLGCHPCKRDQFLHFAELLLGFQPFEPFRCRLRSWHC